MVQSAKSFPHKHEEPSSDTQCLHMYQEAERHVYTPSTGEWRQGDARAHWPTGLEKSVNSVLMGDSCLKKINGESD